MSDLPVLPENVDASDLPVFQNYLGAGFDELAPKVQELHLVYGVTRWVGRARVTRGRSPWSRVLAVIFGFPAATDDTPVDVVMTPKDGGELWERRFGTKRFWSFLKVQKGQMTERFGPFTFTLGLHVADGQLLFPVDAGRIGPVPFPKFLLPISIAREFERDGRFHFDVELRAPVTAALMVHYQGWLEPAASRLGD